MTKAQGYTLIELMMVIAIIGILAAVAIPLYQNFILKTRVTALYSQLVPGKTGVELLLANGGTAPSNEQDIGLTRPDACVAPLVVNATQIRCTLQGLGSAVDGKMLALNRDASSGAWTCSTDVPVFYAPGGCR